MSYTGRIDFSPSTGDDSDPDIIYYSGLIINDSLPTALTQDPPIRFIEARTIPLVRDASKYQFSIVRFQMNGAGKTLPIWCPVIEIGPTRNPTQDVNLTIYRITQDLTVNYQIAGVFRTTTLTSTKPVIFVPEYLDPGTAPVPPSISTVTGQQLAPTKYYWITSYANACNMFNNTFVSVMADLQTQFNAWYLAQPGAVGPAPTLGTQASRILYNPGNNLFTIYSSVYSFGGTSRTSAGTTTDESSRLYFNAPLYGLLSNYETVKRADENKAYEIIVKNVGNLYQNAITVGPPLNQSFWLTVQDYESTSTLWSPVDSIVFVSGMLPLAVENVSEPIRFGGTNLGNVQTSQAFEPVITDVALEMTSANNYREYFQYVPTAEYRMLSTLRSQNAIQSFDITCFWKSRLDGKLYPLQLYTGGSASIKIMLRRRGVADYPHPRREFGMDV